MEFQFFDLESISELGLAPELLQPEDLLLGVKEVQDVPATTKVEEVLDNTDSIFTIKDEDLKDLDNTYNDASFDLFSLMDMEDITEVTTVPTTTTILDSAIEECGIGSPTSTIGEPSPSPPIILEKEHQTEIEKTQELIDDVETYLQSVEGTSTTIAEDDIQATFEEMMAEDNPPITVEGNPSLMEAIEEVFPPTETYEVPIMEHVTTQKVAATPAQNTTNALLQALASGKVALNDSGMSLTEEDLSRAYTTTMMTEDGQSMVIIIAPPSPPPSPANSCISLAPQLASPGPSISPGPSTISLSDYDSSYDTDPDYSPGSASRTSCTSRTSYTSRTNSSVNQIHEKTMDEPPRRKYERRNKPRAPEGPYPVDKKERKKAQNRTAAFRYREKKKQEQEVVEGEVETLVKKNGSLKAKLTDVENELRILKKLMTEAGLGKYANVVRI